MGVILKVLVLQSCAFRAGAAEVYFAYYTCTTKLRFSNWGCRSVLRVLHLYYKAAMFKLELRKCTFRTTLVLQSCDFRAGYKAAIFELELWKCTSRTTLVLQGCDFELELRKCTRRTTLVLHLNKPLGLRKRLLVTRPMCVEQTFRTTLI